MRKIWQFIKNEKGAVFVTIALTFVAMTGIVASALDYSRGSLLKSELQAALDSAALAGGTVANETTLNATITKYFNANLPAGYMGSTIAPLTITQPADKSTLTVAASASLQDAMMPVVGWSTTNVAASTQVTIEKKGMELVLVLDNTGSMTESAGGTQSKLQALQTASTTLLNILYGSNDTLPNFWVGVVPFSQAVNIGTTRSSWTTGVSSQDWGTSNSWKGCVEARYASGRDITDDPPSVALFPPYYSACVAWSSSNPWYNSWYGNSKQNPGSGSPSYSLYTGCSKSGSWHYTSPLDTQITISSSAYNWGPNQYCPSTPILSMEASKTTVLNTINSMQANGDTDIDLGLVWGWRLLSPKWRYTTGTTGTTSLWGGDMATYNFSGQSLPLDYNTPLMSKVVILLTDGDNNVTVGNYTAYGAASTGILGANVTSSNDASANTALVNKTLSVCNSLKANGVLIYTIALGSEVSSTGQSLLQSCASNTAYYFNSPTTTQLNGIFEQIADSLSNLRISQ